MVVLTSDVVHTRLQDIKNPTQEAIETMSLWIMHYKDKASIDLIVDGWLNCFKTAGTDEKRVALFYVMNDVVQKAKMKHADMLIPAFQPAVLTAVGIGRKQDKVKLVMKRCIQIFKSRNVFSPASITAMENLLDESFDAEDQALEVDVDDLIKKITSFVSARNLIVDMMKCVNDGDFDYKEKCRSGMRDRESGAHILQEVHEAIDTMVQVRHSMEDHKKKMMALCETLELAKRVFLHQKREVLVVEEAYVNFRDGIKAVHTELLEMQEKEQYPGIVTSPIADDEPFGAGSSTGAGDHYQQSATSWGDNRAQIDMDIDDEDRPAASIMKPSLQALLGIASQPSLQSRIMQLGLKKIADGDEEMLQHSKVAAAAASQQRDAEKADFTRPPPAVFGAPAGAASNAFGVPIKAPPAITTPAADPRIQSTEGPSQYTLALQKHGLLPPPQPPVVPQSQPAPQKSAYSAQFETRDPRLLAQQSVVTAAPPIQQPPPVSAYHAQFEQRDPRQQGGYQATFDAPKAPMISPQPQTGGYQARFDPPHTMPPPQPPGIPPPQQMKHYHQQPQSGGFNRPPTGGGYSDYQQNSGGGKDIDSRFDNQYRGGGGGNGHYQPRNSGYEDRRSSAGPYNNNRGGGDRWRNEGGRGDVGGGFRGRGNWRGGGGGGNRGAYNRY